MAGHFEAIGFELADEEALAQVVERAVAEGEPRARTDGGTTRLWRDASGASVVVHLDESGAIWCTAPSFPATSTFPVRVNGTAADPECRFCSVLMVEVLDDGEMIYPLAAQLESIDEALERDFDGQEHELALTAFGEEVEVWPDETSYNEQPGEEPRLGPQSLIPSGLFVPEEKRSFLRRRRPETGPRAQAIITGIVETAETLRNESSGGEFQHARVATYGPTLDVVISSQDVPTALAPGNVVQGTFWLIGRLDP